jgi:uncharacterized protein (DUF2252 family)
MSVAQPAPADPPAPSGSHEPPPPAQGVRGRQLRRQVPRSSHGDWAPPVDRRDPVELLEAQGAARIAELVPIRHGRMAVSSFAYFRGAALPMAADLANTPTSGITVQLCGDAHLSNFGIFGSPERHLIFSLNDFDETHPGPWEWDVKRLAASLEIAGRENGFADDRRSAIVRRAMRSYRETMRDMAGMSTLEVWYVHLDMEDLLPRFRRLLDPKSTPAVWRAATKARAHDSLQAFDKLCHRPAGEPRIAPDPPLIVPIEDLYQSIDTDAVSRTIQKILRSYRRTLSTDRRHLLDQYRVVHLARKVVGVGSVGTAAWIVLLLDEHGTPLFLQLKEANASVLEPFTAKSPFSQHGARVVAGQRLMQAASDIFLGWERFEWEGEQRDCYIRQLRDWKGSADVAGMTPAGMELWARMCGWTLARAHARSGDRAAIAGYLGRSDRFDRAITDFASAYADQNERDYAAFCDAIAAGRLAAATGL